MTTSAFSLPKGQWTSAQAFRRLHPGLQEWVRGQRWAELRPLQIAATEHVLSGAGPLVLSAGVASGKTEAAFLPLLSALDDQSGPGFEVVYVAPLVALIDDQARRLESIAASIGRKVTPWHGDIPQSIKAAAKKAPQGILLITPESLDSFLSNHPLKARAAFGHLAFVVIDELHAFLGTERGTQLQSVLARLEHEAGCRPKRIGLSATLGDIAAARSWLAPHAPGGVSHIGDPSPRRAPVVELHGIEEPALQDASAKPVDLASAIAPRVLRGKHLIFANGRKRVEELADQMRPALAGLSSTTEVYVHHSNIAKFGRKAAEKSLREAQDTCLVCTSTLELGIDVPQVASVAQLGPPPAVASLKQRAGRSGRGETRGFLHVYCAERNLDGRSPLFDRLRPRLVQAVAMIELMQEGWIEPPRTGRVHLSTLVHQTLALLLQKSGAAPRDLWAILCTNGAFRSVDWPLYRRLLSQLKQAGLVRQDDGVLVHLDEKGARIATHYTFPVIFETPAEWTLIHSGQTLGTLPRVLPTLPKDLILFAGRRWQVVGVDQDRHILEVKPSSVGSAPEFGGDIAPLHDRVRQRMREVYVSANVPAYCRGDAARLLAEARTWFHAAQLAERVLYTDGADTLLIHWMGDRAAATLRVLLAERGVKAVEEGSWLRAVRTDESTLLTALSGLDKSADPVVLALAVQGKASEKYDRFLNEELLSLEYAQRMLDVDGALAIADAVLRA